MKLALLITYLSLSFYSSSLDKIYNVIRHVETDNRTHVIGDGGKAFGVVQIHKICVDDINRIYGTSYTHEDAFNRDCAREMFVLYLTAGIQRFKSKYNRLPTEGEIVRMWNGGIYKGYRINMTQSYLRRYKRYKLKLLSK